MEDGSSKVSIMMTLMVLFGLANFLVSSNTFKSLLVRLYVKSRLEYHEFISYDLQNYKTMKIVQKMLRYILYRPQQRYAKHIINGYKRLMFFQSFTLLAFFFLPYARFSTSIVFILSITFLVYYMISLRGFVRYIIDVENFFLKPRVLLLNAISHAYLISNIESYQYFYESSPYFYISSGSIFFISLIIFNLEVFSYKIDFKKADFLQSVASYISTVTGLVILGSVAYQYDKSEMSHNAISHIWTVLSRIDNIGSLLEANPLKQLSSLFSIITLIYIVLGGPHFWRILSQKYFSITSSAQHFSALLQSTEASIRKNNKNCHRTSSSRVSKKHSKMKSKKWLVFLLCLIIIIVFAIIVEYT